MRLCALMHINPDDRREGAGYFEPDGHRRGNSARQSVPLIKPRLSASDVVDRSFADAIAKVAGL